MEFLFRGSKAGQKRCENVVSRKQTMVGGSGLNLNSMPPCFSTLKGEAGGGEVMLDLMMLYPRLDVGSPLSTYADGNG